MCEHTSPVKGRRVLSGAASNIPTPTIKAVACTPGYSPKTWELKRTDFQKTGDTGQHLQENCKCNELMDMQYVCGYKHPAVYVQF